MGNEKENSDIFQNSYFLRDCLTAGSSVRKKVGVCNHLKTVSKLDGLTLSARSFFTSAQSMSGAAPVSWGGSSSTVSAQDLPIGATSFFR